MVGIVALRKLGQAEKTLYPKYVTVLGITTSPEIPQEENVSCNCVTPGGIIAVPVNSIQPEKLLLPNEVKVCGSCAKS